MLTLVIVRTSEPTVSYRLLDAEAKILYRTRADATTDGHTGARVRMTAWAERHQVEVDEPAGDDATRRHRLQLLRDLREQTRLLAGKDVRQISRAEVAALTLPQLEAAIDRAREDLTAEQVTVAQESNRRSRAGRR